MLVGRAPEAGVYVVVGTVLRALVEAGGATVGVGAAGGGLLEDGGGRLGPLQDDSAPIEVSSATEVMTPGVLELVVQGLGAADARTRGLDVMGVLQGPA